MSRCLPWVLLALATVACGDRFAVSDDDNNNNDVPTDCGDGVIDPGEACDGDALGGATCESLGFDAGSLGCGADCRHDVSGCVIPAGCGNGVLDPGEDCDGVNLGGQTCPILGYDGGTLACTPACRFDTWACTSDHACGDGVRDLPEEGCDGEDLGGQSCVALGYDGGTLLCGADCQPDVSSCVSQPVCGNGQVETGEECDGANLGGATCQGLGFDEGQLTCDAACGFDDSGCTMLSCGDGVIDSGEECDGANLGGETCQSLGFESGQLGCSATCRLDVTGCTGDPCGNGAIDPGEACDGVDLGGQTCQGLGYPGGQLSCASDCSLDVSGCTPATEDCDNGIDDDLNGACDCGDATCAADAYCVFASGSETSCDDGVDNDLDCLVDCADPDCSNDPACGGSLVCSPFATIDCGGAASGTTVGGPGNLTSYPAGCGPTTESGPEAYFLFTNSGGLFTRTVTVDLVSGGGADLDLIVVGEGNGDCDVVGQCIGSSISPSGTEQVVFTATMGLTYYVIVDGFNGASDSFSLSVSCTSP